VKKKIFVGKNKFRTWDDVDGYFVEKRFYGTWRLPGDVKVKIPSYHKTYETIIKTIIRNDFEIVDYKDTFPIKKSKRLFPEEYSIFSKRPYFCVWKVRKK